jgi:hypothetical protein
VTSRDPKAEPIVGPGADEADDDPQLKSLRAVWLSMPDEDPPERGLAELMAAARVKAEAMTKPSLWQRIAALLLRPPVLALATVLILIGGAVFIGQRKESIGPAEPVVEVDRARDLNAGSAATAPTIAPEQAPVESEEAAQAPTGSAPTIAAPSAEHATADPQLAPARPTRKPPASKPSPSKPTDVKTSTSRGVTRGGEDRTGTSSGTKLEANEGALEKKQVLSSDKFAQPPPPPPSPAPAPPRSPAPQTEAPSAETTVVGGAPQADSGRASEPAPSRAPQYVAQAKSAAARGDCSAARTLMKRVAKEDATVYRNALASDAALKKCVGVVAQ